jgi:hypothetical protein
MPGNGGRGATAMGRTIGTNQITDRLSEAAALITLAAVAFLTIGSVSAEESGDYANTLMWKEFTVIGGGYFSFVDSKVRFDNSSGPGTDIDFEDRLGIDESSATFFAMGRWRINPKTPARNRVF